MEEQQQHPRSRQQLIERLDDLKTQGVLDSTEEAELVRHFDDMLRDSEVEKAKLKVEYDQRIVDDGQDAADVWLTERAHEIGVKMGRATREITDRLKVVTGTSVA